MTYRDITEMYRDLYGQMDGVNPEPTEYRDQTEDTFMMVKPDGLERDLVDDILDYILEHNRTQAEQDTVYADSPLQIRAMTKTRMTQDRAEQHYSGVDADILEEEIFPYFGIDDETDVGHEIVPMVVSGKDAASRVRHLVVDPIDEDADTFVPSNSERGTIRRDIVEPGTALYADPEEWPHYRKHTAAKEDVPLYNLVHAAEDAEHAAEEIELFFGEDLIEAYDTQTA